MLVGFGWLGSLVLWGMVVMILGLMFWFMASFEECVGFGYLDELFVWVAGRGCGFWFGFNLFICVCLVVDLFGLTWGA